MAILNESAARERVHDGNVLGKRVNFPGQRVTAEYEVIGVVRDARYESLRKAAEPMVYIPIEQALDPIGDVMLAIRVRGSATSVVPAIRQRVQATVPGGFLSNIVTLEQQADETLLQERLVSILASAFGGLALFLAAIGLYGTMSFSVIARTREIGIRMAVGAQRSALLWLVLRGTLAVVGIGLVLAAPLVVMATGFITERTVRGECRRSREHCGRCFRVDGGCAGGCVSSGVAGEPHRSDDLAASGLGARAGCIGCAES